MAEDLRAKAEHVDQETVERLARAQVLKNGLTFNPKEYEFDTAFKEADITNPLELHAHSELERHLHQTDCKSQIQGSYLKLGPKGALHRVPFNGRESFLKHLQAGERFHESTGKSPNLREYDSFGRDLDGYGSGPIGQDFTPLLGGPFNKQLYLQDYLRMNSACFFAYHHDPAAIRTVDIVRDFTIGRGFRIDVDNHQGAQAIIAAWSEVNNLDDLCDYFMREICIYGEVMPWELPNGQTKIEYDVKMGQEALRGLLPRWRLVDPSCIWEIVTFPEDIQRKLFYQWVSPTQYQLYDGKDAGKSVGISKFIYQQIPATEMLHFKVNSVSNEKRGRSDLFPALGYMKRVRDTVNYALVAMQKQAAWSIDTTVDGSQSDVDAYSEAVQSLGAMAPAGSEFVHTKAITRTYLSNTAGRAGSHEAFDWGLSMIAMATGIPLQYYGTHLSNSGTRASALVATEPVAKKFEMRQKLLERFLREATRRCLTKFGLPKDLDIEISFPEIVTQDRSGKIKDIQAAQANGYISRRRAAELVAKELGVSKFDYEKEAKAIELESQSATTSAIMTNPLSSPGLKNDSEPAEEPKGITSNDRKEITQNERSL